MKKYFSISIVVFIILFSVSNALTDDEFKTILMHGDWTVYTGKSKSHIRPKISFEIEDKCNYISVGGDSFEGTWKVKSGRLIIKKDDDEESVLPSGSYKIDYKTYMLKGDIKLFEIKLTSAGGKRISLKSQI